MVRKSDMGIKTFSVKPAYEILNYIDTPNCNTADVHYRYLDSREEWSQDSLHHRQSEVGTRRAARLWSSFSVLMATVLLVCNRNNVPTQEGQRWRTLRKLKFLKKTVSLLAPGQMFALNDFTSRHGSSGRKRLLQQDDRRAYHQDDVNNDGCFCAF
ncbi:uncharacterized protein LOC144991007 isoform X1 [Oryzias latipes]